MTAANQERQWVILWLLDRGANLREIARLLKVNISTVCHDVRRMEREGLVKRVGTMTKNVRYVRCPDKPSPAVKPKRAKNGWQDEPTEAELEQTIAEQRANLPAWWNQSGADDD